MAPKCCNRVCCCYCGVISFAILIVLAGCSYIILNPVIESVMYNEFVINSPEAVRYADWACKFSTLTTGDCAVPHDSVPFYESYYMFNLTNLDEVMAGGRAKYMELGPYTYRVSITKFDIVFSDEGRKVSYKECNTYFWTPELSCEGCTPEDVIVGVNTGYLGAIETAGSEDLLLVGLTGPAVNRTLYEVMSLYLNDYLIGSQNQTEQSIIARCNEVEPTANCTTLFDAALVQWFSFSYTARVGLQRMGLFNQTVTGLFPEFPDPFEYSYINPINNLLPVQLSMAAVKTLLYGEYGIVENPLNLLDAASLLNNPTELLARYGVTRSQFVAFSGYFNVIRLTYNYRLCESVIYLDQGGGLFSARSVYQWVFNFEDPLLMLLQPGDPQTGIRSNDTSFEDASSYKIGIEMWTGQDNITLVAEVIMWNGTDTITFWPKNITVGGNNQDGQFYFQLTNGRGQQPETFPDFPVWSPDHARTVLLQDTRVNVDILGITNRRFYLKNETYDVDPDFNQFYQGFIDASIYHSDPPFRKRLVFGALIPLYMSQPRFYYVDPQYITVDILNAEPNFDECATIVDVEVISGNAMYAKKRLQVNFLFSNQSNTDVFYPNVTKGFYPSLWVEQSSQVTEALADEWSSELGLGLTIEKVLFIAGLVIGSVGFVCCLVLLMKAKKSGGYEAIN